MTTPSMLVIAWATTLVASQINVIEAHTGIFIHANVLVWCNYVDTVHNIQYGRGTGPIHLSMVNCTWSEIRLIDCPSRTTQHTCNHSQDAGVFCTIAGIFNISDNIIKKVFKTV